MKNYIPKYVFLGVSILFLSCSSNDQSETVVTPVPVTPPVTSNPSDVLKPENAKQYLVDKNATAETVALFYNLKKLAKTKFAIGQQDAFLSFYNNAGGDSDIKKTTGNDPAIVGSDLTFVTDIRNDGTSSNWFYQQEINNYNQIKKSYDKGIINTVSWHLRGPKNKNYPATDGEEYTFNVKDMFEADKSTFFRSILPGGTRHDWFKAKLDQVASFTSKLKGSKGEMIPIIFRPFHEFDGDFFWWGAPYSSNEEFKTAFRFIVDYLKNTKNIHNILYDFGPDRNYDTQAKFLSRYPGDDYVDILSVDDYWSLSGNVSDAANEANKRLKIISDLAKTKVKIAAMGETGYYVGSGNSPIKGWFSDWVYTALTKNDLEISFVLFWSNSGNGYFVPTPSNSNVQDFKDFTLKPKATLLNALPKMYELPK